MVRSRGERKGERVKVKEDEGKNETIHILLALFIVEATGNIANRVFVYIILMLICPQSLISLLLLVDG